MNESSSSLAPPATHNVPETLRDKNIYCLDSHGLIFQLFYALPPMTSPRGESVNAVFGFAKDLLTLWKSRQLDYLWCAFDTGEKTFRHGLDDKYKANRAAAPDELRSQFALVRELIDAFGFVSLTAAGFEADDILATVAAETERRGGHCSLVTADKDARQLISEKTSLYLLRKQQAYGAAELFADWGITPAQVVDFQAMCGDTADNIAGIAGIGPKTATQLLQQFGTLDKILAMAEQFSGKKREMLLHGRAAAEHSRELVRLRSDVPIKLDWEAARCRELDEQRLHDCFNRFGFRTLIGAIEEVAHTEARRHKEDLQNSFVSSAALCEEKRSGVSYKTVTAQNIENFFSQLAAQEIFSVDTETISRFSNFSATQPRAAQIVGLSFCWSDHEAWYLPILAPLGEETFDAQTIFARLKPILENSAIRKIGQNLKYDKVVLRGAGIELAGLAFDTMLADYLLHSGMRQHNLDILAETYLNHKTIRIEELIGSGSKQKTMREVSIADITNYAGEDAWVVWKLYPLMQAKLAAQSPEMLQLFTQLEMPLIEVLVDLEWNGITINAAKLKELSQLFAARLSELETEIFALAGHPFLLTSPKQLATVLFDELHLPIIKKTKTGASTDIEVLEELATRHELPERVIAHRQLSKLKGTYADALPQLIHPQTQRIHAAFNQVVTATGRLSSSDPNLQNIPTRSEDGRAIRAAFIPGAGFDLLLACDYSQIELRVLAHFSQDEKLCAAIISGDDIHTSVAAEIFGVPESEVTKEMRQQAKAVNFGIIYGQTAFGLAKQLSIPQDAAKNFITAYRAKYAGVVTFMDSVLDVCVERGIVSTLDGRERRIAGVRPSNSRRGDLNANERMAINTVIQGTAADLMKRAMLSVHKLLASKKFNAALLLSIHDELIFETTLCEVDALKSEVIEAMSLGQPLRVPLVIDSEINNCWS